MPSERTGYFIPTTFSWEIEAVRNTPTDPQLKELIVKLYQHLNIMALAINAKDTGYYPLSEFVNGQQFFPNPALSASTPQSPTPRQVFRTVVNLGALPNAATKSVAHNIIIQAGYTLTRLYAAASKADASSMIPIPYSSTVSAANNIELNIDTTNVNITTGIDQTAYTTCYVIIEMLKQ